MKNVDELLGAAALRRVVVDVEGVSVTVRELSVRERRLMAEKSSTDPLGVATEIVSICVLNDDGNKAFASAEQVEISLRSDVFETLSQKILEISGLGEKPGKD